MNNLAIITARSGSKGLPNKNIMSLCGKPLMSYSIEAANKSGLFTEVMVSTDSEIYADIAMKAGATVPFLRSEEQSGDKAGSWDTVKEVLNNYFKMGIKFDTVCLLQPTSPLRREEDIINGYKLFCEKEAEAVTAVCEVDHSPLWCMTLGEDQCLNEFRSKAAINVPRQNLAKYYRINGALYIRKIVYDKEIVILDHDEYAYIMDRERSIDIDTKLDFVVAEAIMNSEEERNNKH